MIQEIKEYDSDTCSKIGIRIQDIRESRHMKAIELASYLGIGKNQMSRIESGKANCTIPQLYCIAQILDCSADFLLFGEEHMNYSPEMVELVNNLKMVTGRIEYHKHVLRNSTPREWRRQNSPIRNRKGDNKMNKRDFNVVGNEGTDNQELAK